MTGERLRALSVDDGVSIDGGGGGGRDGGEWVTGAVDVDVQPKEADEGTGRRAGRERVFWLACGFLAAGLRRRRLSAGSGGWK